LPGDPITGHSPFILIHTDLTDGKPAPALPAKGKGLIAAMAYARLFPAVPAAGLANGVSIVTGLHFMSLYINQSDWLCSTFTVHVAVLPRYLFEL
jgi:hypothetical protein